MERVSCFMDLMHEDYSAEWHGTQSMTMSILEGTEVMVNRRRQNVNKIHIWCCYLRVLWPELMAENPWSSYFCWLYLTIMGIDTMLNNLHEVFLVLFIRVQPHNLNFFTGIDDNWFSKALVVDNLLSFRVLP
jgi:hypothetical protein